MFRSNENHHGSRRSRTATFTLAAFVHGGVLSLLLLMGTCAPKVITAVTDGSLVYMVAPPRGPVDGGHGNGGQGNAPKAHPTQVVKKDPVTKATPEFVQPQAIPEVAPETTAATDTPVAQNDPKDPGTCVGEHCGGGIPGGPGDGVPCPAGMTCSSTPCPPGMTCNGNGTGDAIDPSKIGVTPVALFQPAPAYPKSAVAANLAGRVVLEIIVGADGRVASAHVTRSLQPFDESALATVKTWRYQPVLYRGQAIAWKSTVTLQFHLR
jgi:protein TonB